MGLDDTVNLERLAAAFEKVASALERLAKVEEDRYLKQYPEKPRAVAKVITPDDDKREQFSDKASPGWFAETEKATSPSRFQKRLDDQKSETDKKSPGSGTPPVH